MVRRAVEVEAMEVVVKNMVAVAAMDVSKSPTAAESMMVDTPDSSRSHMAVDVNRNTALETRTAPPEHTVVSRSQGTMYLELLVKNRTRPAAVEVDTAKNLTEVEANAEMMMSMAREGRSMGLAVTRVVGMVAAVTKGILGGTEHIKQRWMVSRYL